MDKSSGMCTVTLSLTPWVRETGQVFRKTFLSCLGIDECCACSTNTGRTVSIPHCAVRAEEISNRWIREE